MVWGEIKTSMGGKMSNLSIYENGKALDILSNTETKEYVAKILKEKTPQFITSMLAVVGGNPLLQKCTPTSIMGACLLAASMDLPINPALGLAYPVPYSGVCTFVLGWKGIIQLAMRTGQYKKINIIEVRLGEALEIDEFTENYVFSKIPNETKRQNAPIVGYYGFFELLSGFKKEIYWSIEKLSAHGKKYSPSYSSSTSAWKTSLDGMCKKTMIKQLISKWGIMSIEMQTAISSDNAKVEYNENLEAQVDFGDEQEVIEITPNKIDEEFKNSEGEK